MLLSRVIPCLLLNDRRLVKGVEFKNHRYVGDPVNTIRIFNEKEVDELIVLDIKASKENRPPNFGYINQLATECFMPLTYGGGIGSVEHARKLFKLGVEKVSINTGAVEDPELIKKCALEFGSQSVIVSVDVRKNHAGKYELYKLCGSLPTGRDAIEFSKLMEDLGAGEILVNSIDNDGKMSGYDLALIEAISSGVNVPVIACGGARGLNDIKKAIDAGASAAAAGSLFVFYGERRAVLINYPTQEELESLFSDFLAENPLLPENES